LDKIIEKRKGEMEGRRIEAGRQVERREGRKRKGGGV
jgi:hypothetical protein